jgi:hypothetical protein
MTTLKEKIKIVEEELIKLKEIMNEFPDVELSRDGMSSPEVNKIATHVEYKNTCGCCPGTPFASRFYIERFGIKIYAHPIEIWIGYDNENGGGKIFKDNWKDVIFNINKINPELIETVQKFVDDNQAYYSDDDDEDD